MDQVVQIDQVVHVVQVVYRDQVDHVVKVWDPEVQSNNLNATTVQRELNIRRVQSFPKSGELNGG